MTIEFSSLDMHDCKKLHEKVAEVYIRKGKCFLYIDNQRYNINPVPPGEEWRDEQISNGVMTSNIDFGKDHKYEGSIIFIENKEGYLVGIANYSNPKEPLVVIRMKEKPTLN
jgi:hypothetical protein